MSNEDILEFHNYFTAESHSEGNSPCGVLSPCDRPGFADVVTMRVRERVRDLLSSVTMRVRERVTDLLSSDGDNDAWQETHQLRRANRQERVGVPAKSSRGDFDRLAAVMHRHFGLEVWISHVQKSVPAKFSHESTVAYLRLAQKTEQKHDWENRVKDLDYSETSVATEASFANVHSVPPTPSDKSLARFGRVMKALDLQPLNSQHEDFDSTSKPREDTPAVDKDFDKVKGTSFGKNDTGVWPQLTIFVRHTDDEEW